MGQDTLDFVNENAEMLKRKGMIRKYTSRSVFDGGSESVVWTFYLYSGTAKVCRSTFEAKEWIVGVCQGILWFHDQRADYHLVDLRINKFDIHEN